MPPVQTTEALCIAMVLRELRRRVTKRARPFEELRPQLISAVPDKGINSRDVEDGLNPGLWGNSSRSMASSKWLPITGINAVAGTVRGSAISECPTIRLEDVGSVSQDPVWAPRAIAAPPE